MKNLFLKMDQIAAIPPSYQAAIPHDKANDAMRVMHAPHTGPMIFTSSDDMDDDVHELLYTDLVLQKTSNRPVQVRIPHTRDISLVAAFNPPCCVTPTTGDKMADEALGRTLCVLSIGHHRRRRQNRTTCATWGDGPFLILILLPTKTVRLAPTSPLSLAARLPFVDSSLFPAVFRAALGGTQLINVVLVIVEGDGSTHEEYGKANYRFDYLGSNCIAWSSSLLYMPGQSYGRHFGTGRHS
jgi:hypothetical protein